MSYLRDKYDLGVTFAFVGDIQGEVQYSSAIVTAQFQWLSDHGADVGIEVVISSGDNVNTDGDDTQWATAESLYDLLEAANMPYLICIGNHDYDGDGSRNLTDFWSYFPTTRYTTKSWWNGGFYEAGHAENLYCIIGGKLYLILEFGPRQAVIDWANTILTTYSGYPAIICTHSYLYRDGTRVSTGDEYNPHGYYADTHDGDEMWTELVKLHNNVLMVCSGHDFDSTDGNSKYLQSTLDGGATATQVLSNYQSLTPNYGDGYTKMFKVNQALHRISAYTISYTAPGAKTTADHMWVVTY